MKRSKICLFAFRPEHYRQMEAYLNQMMASGWKLSWCRGVLASFVPAEQTLHYAVDPQALTSLAYFRRYPKRRLREQMEAGWYGAARSKGCQILCTPREDPAPPVPPKEDLGPLIRSTCRLASLIWILVLAALGLWLTKSAAVVYALILTNMYLILGALGVCLLAFHVLNVILLTLPSAKRTPANPRLCGRYFLHTGMLFLLLLAAAALEVGGRNDMLFYLMIPIAVIFAAILLLQSISRGQRDVNRLFPVIIVVSVLLFCMIIFLNNRMSDANAAWSTQQRQELLDQADALPVLHLSDFGPEGEKKSAVKVNRSILADNLLYAEESPEAGYVFTNHTVTRSPALAERIFRYLHQQAQTDFHEAFREQSWNGEILYVLEEARTALFMRGGSVYYFTVPEGADLEACAALLLERSAP